MQGFQLTFFTQQDQKHGAMPLAEWLFEQARELGIRGATLFTAAEGFGKTGRVHSTHFIELSDQPVEVTMVVTTDEADQILEFLRREKVNVFYVKAPVEFGSTAD